MVLKHVYGILSYASFFFLCFLLFVPVWYLFDFMFSTIFVQRTHRTIHASDTLRGIITDNILWCHSHIFAIPITTSDRVT